MSIEAGKQVEKARRRRSVAEKERRGEGVWRRRSVAEKECGGLCRQEAVEWERGGEEVWRAVQRGGGRTRERGEMEYIDLCDGG